MEQKLITFTVPCYNSEKYMAKCIDSILDIGEKNIEIIIVNDGSKDGTGNIADEYEKKFPEIIKVIHQENGGHGEGVNQGIRNAKGIYFKVVDSDDWLDKSALQKIINEIKELKNKNKFPDLILSNYVYEYSKDNSNHIVHYKKIFPENKIFMWEETKKAKLGQYILMHSTMYKTEILRKSKMELPKHTFYVDNIYVFEPLLYVNTMYYVNVDLYRYFIGREDQSVNEQIMAGRIEQQLKITKIMIDFYNENEEEITKNKHLKNYMIKYLVIMCIICNVFTYINKTNESKQNLRKFWNNMKEQNEKLYKKIRYNSVCIVTFFPKIIVIPVYRITRKIFKFN